MTTIRLETPRIEGQTVSFDWTVDPHTSLYHETGFTLTLPESIDPRSVPPAVWARVMLICLHTHWVLLRPARVVLPFRLPDGEREFWQRMTDAASWSLETRRKVEGEPFSRRALRQLEIVETGAPLEPFEPVDDNGIVTACFSGGRDSLTQLSILQELGETPLLVTTTSDRDGSDEMQTARRRHVIDEIQARRGLEMVEVESTLRGCVDNTHPTAQQFGAGVNELTDTYLYFAVAWAVAVARGARAVFLASEAEVQETQRRDGLITQHKHFMYSAVTQQSLRALIAPTGITHGGLTYPLHQFQIQRLLGARYDDIRDLQYSCWLQAPGEASCSRCGECFTIAVSMMTDGIQPSEIGIDVNLLLDSQRGWEPKSQKVPESDRHLVSSRSYPDSHALRFFSEASDDLIAGFTLDGKLSPDGASGLAAIRRTVAAAEHPGAEPGFRAGYLEFIDPKLREGLAKLIAEQFDPEPEQNYHSLLENTRLLTEWITAPLSVGPVARQVETTVSVDDRPAAPTPPKPIEPSTEQLAAIAGSIPGTEPPIQRDGVDRFLPVADTDLSGNELAYVTEAVESNWVSSAGPQIEELERRFAEYCGVRHAVTAASGAAALEVMLRAAGIGPGDEVIIPTFTMVATANAVHHCGAKVVFVDSDLATWNMDLGQVRLAIGPRTRAIIAMHTYGHPVDMSALREIADANSLALFEDAAEAHGAVCHGRRAGALADAAAFSFYGNKILTTGEGGIVTTDDDEIAQTARDLRSHAFSQDRHFWHRRRAFNYRMSNLQAALGLAQLERIDEFLDRRRGLARMYREHLSRIPGVLLAPEEEGLVDANWMFGIVLDDDFPVTRDALRVQLANDGIETRTFFVPLHLQPAYLDENAGRRHPAAEALGARGLYLPSALWLEERDVARIASRIAQAAGTESHETSSPNFA